MATTNNAIQVSAALSCSLLSQPPIGQSASFNLAYTDGDTAGDNYVSCAISTGTALNADIGGNGMLLVTNPSTNLYNVTLKISSTTIGDIMPGCMALLPLNSGTIVTGVSATAAQTVGVTVLECDLNA